MFIKGNTLFQGSNKYEIINKVEDTVNLFTDKGTLRHGEKNFKYEQFKLLACSVYSVDNPHTPYYLIVATDLMTPNAIINEITYNGHAIDAQKFPDESIHVLTFDSTTNSSKAALEEAIKHLKRSLMAAKASMDLN